MPLDLLLMVCVAPELRAATSQVELSGRSASGAASPPHRFTFASPSGCSPAPGVAMAVEGVASVEVKRFRRWGKQANQEMENGVLRTAPLEIVRLDNDPSLPQNGRIELDMRGGQ